MNPELLQSDIFEHGLKDYFYLINRGYPEKGSLKLVGDRYKLSKEFRTILYRGVCSSESSANRSRKIINVADSELMIDGYNVLFTLLNYRLGRFVFISTDSLCRDAGSLFGKIMKEKYFTECLDLLIKYLAKKEELIFEIYLDSPVSMNKKHKHHFEKLIIKHKLKGTVHVVPSADKVLSNFSGKTIATSDSVIIDQSNNYILDIPRIIIEEEYNIKLYSLRDKLNTLMV